MRKIRPLLLLFSIGSLLYNGCARDIVLHPVTDKDIKEMDGWICMTPAYVARVVQAKLEAKGL